MPFSETTITLSPDQTRLGLKKDGQELTFHQVLNDWAANPSFRKFYWQTLLAHGGNGCLWEHPRLTPTSAEQPYECVITRTGSFNRFSATPKPFRAEMEVGSRISTFPNLNGDALLIIPNEPAQGSVFNCRDLISFCRTAPEGWLHEFWEAVGKEVLAALEENSPRQFLSTHGFGVLWLHVRLEERPKYYRYMRYR